MTFALLAATAAILGPHEVAFLDTTTAVVARSVPLPGEGLAIFAAPDGKIIVPLAERDGTAVVSPQGTVTTWKGRIFPLFFDEDDRMHVAMPGLLATLSYPERLLLWRVDAPGLAGVRHAACSADGRLVAVIPAPPRDNVLLLGSIGPEGGTNDAQLDGSGVVAAAAPDGAWVAVALEDGSLELFTFGGGASHSRVALPSPARCLTVSPDGRWILAGVGDSHAGGGVVGIRVQQRGEHRLRLRFSNPAPSPIVGIAATSDGAVAVSGEAVLLLTHEGRRTGHAVAFAGARAVALIPERLTTTIPQWSDQ